MSSLHISELSTRRLSAQDFGSTYKKDRGPISSQYGPVEAWLITHLLHD